MRNDSQMKIFSGSASYEFTKRICEFLGVTAGDGNVITFSEGNIYVKIGEKVRGMDVYVIQTIGINPNNEFMELLFWVDAFKRAGVNSVTAIIPFFSYAQADKKDEPRVSIRARVCADCLEVAGVDKVVTMDLHSPQIQGFFRKPVDHLYASGIFCDYIASMNLDSFLIAAPDEGFAKNARYYANRFGVPLVIGNKQRVGHDEKAEILSIIGEVKEETAVIVDDFSISGGTLIETANALRAKGAQDIYAFITHAVLSEQGVKSLGNSILKKVFVTDTINNPFLRLSDKIEIISVTDLFAQAIRIIHEKDSLSELFDE